jgi:hypothetical protein
MTTSILKDLYTLIMAANKSKRLNIRIKIEARPKVITLTE